MTVGGESGTLSAGDGQKDSSRKLDGFTDRSADSSIERKRTGRCRVRRNKAHIVRKRASNGAPFCDRMEKGQLMGVGAWRQIRE